MRLVADRAVFRCRRVFKDVRSAFFCVAGVTRVIDAGVPGQVVTYIAVWRVAVGAGELAVAQRVR